jgi:hypothetical protein
MRGRVVLECDVPVTALDRVEALEAAGFAVERCSGPDHHRCPVLHGKPCPAITAADVVVNGLSAHAVEVSTATAMVHPDVSQVTLLPRFDAEDVAAVVRLGNVVPNDADDDELVTAVLAALTHQETR